MNKKLKEKHIITTIVAVIIMIIKVIIVNASFNIID